MTGWVELRVQENDKDVLVYSFENTQKAAEMIDFLSGMMPPSMTYLVQPLRH
jgi:hypothetical protein